MAAAKRIEEQLWKVTLSFQDIGDFTATLTALEWDALPLRAQERVMVRFGISSDRMRGAAVEAMHSSRTIG